jgi:hypothetical protein
VRSIERFDSNFKELATILKKMRWCIPALHVLDHRDRCMYLFAAAYMLCVGHFFAESVETYWAECNQLGSQVKQMNNGHRQDTLNDHHGHWNWKKTTIMGKPTSQLPTLLIRSKRRHYTLI